MGLNLGRLLVGKPLATTDLEHQSISRPIGLAVFASDALSSTAYATEEILIILGLAFGAGVTLWSTDANGINIFGLSLPIALAISVLLVIVTLSYRQTIYAYPGGGGAYIVARDNLGEVAAQIAGAALLTDYILTVAVSISSGVAQIVSALPSLLPYRVGIALAVIALITVKANLRGVKESGRIFAVPTYYFHGAMFFTLGVGFFKHFTGSLGSITPTEAALESFRDLQLHHGGFQELGLFLILRAFSSGCTALTGIEAISNGITAFKKPRSHNAAVTLIWMSSILIVLFLSITFLANQIQALPAETETIISQLGRTIYGDGNVLWYVLLAGTALILLMAANTSYADFPRLAALHAGDGFLPRQLTYRGSRLVFSWGIMVLAVSASILVIIANASVTVLIPLYAVGVFLSFTMSQTGMVVRLWKSSKLKPGERIESLETAIEFDPQWRTKIAVSAVGAVSTLVVMIVFAVTKFTSGAWVIVVLVPVLVFIFFRIHHHYKDVAKILSRERAEAVETRPVKTVILVDNVHAETIRMVNFAKSLGNEWVAVHVGVSPERAAETERKWRERILGEDDKLVILPSPYRLLTEPIRDYIKDLQDQTPGSFVHVIMGHLVMETFWEQALHQNSAFIFNLGLSQMENVVVTTVPYQIYRTEGSTSWLSSVETPRSAAFGRNATAACAALIGSF
ncbi:MAG: APC family permease [Armatimonadetes bacterium]|nr:APC family permease [Anaerolineae bacterium]